MRARRKILLLFIVLAAGLALWPLFKKEESRHQGKTAREWVDFRKKRGNNDAYLNALATLNTNFFEVFAHYSNDKRQKWKAYGDLIISILPKSVIPKPVFKFLLRPAESFLQGNRAAKEGAEIINWQAYPQADVIWREHLRREEDFDRQLWIWTLYQHYLAGTNLHARPTLAERHFSSRDDSHRLCAAWILVEHLFGAGSDRNDPQMIAALGEGITNSVLLTQTFGENAKKWQKEIFDKLMMAAPAIAETYRGYLNQ